MVGPLTGCGRHLPAEGTPAVNLEALALAYALGFALEPPPPSWGGFGAPAYHPHPYHGLRSRYVAAPPSFAGLPDRIVTDTITGCRYLLRWPNPSDPCRVEAITVDPYGLCEPLPIRKTCR
jgi:hypothetical protein